MSTPIFIDSYVSSTSISSNQVKKMIFIMNSLEKGWTVKKRDGNYIFTKKHENKREVFRETYLETFVQENFNPSILEVDDQ
jgi:hypothetical protein